MDYQDLERQVEANMEKLKGRLSELLELRLRGEISAAELAESRASYQAELTKLQVKAERLRQRMVHATEVVDSVLVFVKQAMSAWTAGDDKMKRQIAGTLAESYVLTNGDLKIQPHRLLAPLLSIEPPSGHSYMVQDGISRSQNPQLCA